MYQFPGGSGKGRPAPVFLVILIASLLVTGIASSASRGAIALDHHVTLTNGRVTGSSFLLRDGVAVTNAHVLNGRGVGGRVSLVTRGGGRHSARIIAVSPRMDLALLDVPAGWAPPVSRDAPRVGPGRAVVAAGVDGQNRRVVRRMELAGEVTSGRRTLPRFGPGLVARIPGVRQGFSGGPVLDRDGRLVGMLTALKPKGGSSARGEEAFILTAREIRNEARRLLAGR